MAQATKSSTAKKSSTSRKSTAKKSNSSGASAKRSNSKSGSSTARRPASKSKSTNARSAASKNGSSALSNAGQSVAAAASKAKTPLIAGGAAIAGAAGTILVKNRMAPKGPMQKLKRVSLPKPNGSLKGKLDLETMKSTAERVSSFGQQAADIAAAAEKTRKKNK